MQIKKKQVNGCLNCSSKVFTFEKDILGKKYPTKCRKCGTQNRRIVNYCPYCNSKKYFPWGNKIRDFYSAECSKCHLVYIKNPLSAEAQNLYYKNYATNVHQKRNIKVKQRSIMYKQELNYLKSVVENFNNIKNVLDVGCGGGFFLDLFKKYNKKTYGVEVGDDSYLIAKKKHKMYYGNFDNNLNLKKKFDLIIMRGVVEHVENPKKYILKAQKILKKDGYIFISATPDLSCISAKIFKERWTQHRPESHILHLSENHIDNLFLNKKFTKVGSKSFYLKTPYENFEKDINEIVLEIKRQKKGIKSKSISPAFFGNMITLIYKKR